MKIRDILTINTYGGSLLVGAAAHPDLKVRASLEDASYGVTTQRANFPDLRIVPKPPWPDEDLTKTIVLAHPPCSAFSTLTVGAKNRGLDSAAFACTRRVLDYTLGRRAPALAVESVMGALEGARAIHDEHAARAGYRLYRIRQNAASFGVAQDRTRFWAVFVRGDLKVPKTWSPVHVPTFRTVGDVMDASAGDPGPAFTSVARRLETQLDTMRENGMEEKRIRAVLSGKHGAGLFMRVYQRANFEPGVSIDELYTRYHPRRFQAKTPRLLDPDLPANTLLSDILWVSRGRTLSGEEYREIMGFPRSYILPGGVEATALLARGVCPPIAAWILGQLRRHLGDVKTTPPAEAIRYAVEPGEVLDLTGELAAAPWATPKSRPERPQGARSARVAGTTPPAPGRSQGSSGAWSGRTWSLIVGHDPAAYGTTQKALVVRYLRDVGPGTAREIADEMLAAKRLITHGTDATPHRVRSFVAWALQELKQAGVVTKDPSTIPTIPARRLPRAAIRTSTITTGTAAPLPGSRCPTCGRDGWRPSA